MAYDRKGDPDRAIVWHEKAREIDEKIYSRDKYPDGHPSLATTYGNLGSAYNRKGDPDRAIVWLEKAREIQEKIYSRDKYPEGHPDLATTYNNLGPAYNRKGDPDRAIVWLEKAREIEEKIYSRDKYPDGHPDLATTYYNLGSAYDRKGDPDRAIVWYEKAREIEEKIYSRDKYPDGHPSLATTYNNLGSAYDSKGDYDRAIVWYEKALALQRKAQNLPNTVIFSRNIYLAYIGADKPVKALEGLEPGLDALDEAVAQGNMALLSENIDLYYRGVEVSHRLDRKEKVFFFSEKLRSQALLERLTLKRALSVEGVSPDLRREMLSLAQEIENLYRRRSGLLESHDERSRKVLLSLGDKLDKARKRFRELDRKLILENPKYRALRSPKIISLDDARGMAPEDGAIVEYVLYQDEDHGNYACAIVITRERATVVELDREAPYSPWIEALSQEIQSRSRGGGELRQASLRAFVRAP